MRANLIFHEPEPLLKGILNTSRDHCGPSWSSRMWASRATAHAVFLKVLAQVLVSHYKWLLWTINRVSRSSIPMFWLSAKLSWCSPTSLIPVKCSHAKVHSLHVHMHNVSSSPKTRVMEPISGLPWLLDQVSQVRSQGEATSWCLEVENRSDSSSEKKQFLIMLST